MRREGSHRSFRSLPGLPFESNRRDHPGAYPDRARIQPGYRSEAAAAMTHARRIVLRADASQSIGTGHDVRCATLAAELVGRGWRATIASRELPSVLERSLMAEGI